MRSLTSIALCESGWLTTLPHRVAPMPDEWLSGLLLRCDESNHWASRTTLAYLLSSGPEKFHRCWRVPTPNLGVIPPFSLHLDTLAVYLALPPNILLATTYHLELMRLYDTTSLHPTFLNASFPFHLCPACLAEARLLRRTLALPHLTLCPQHQIRLMAQCQCGTVFHLFHRQRPPFTCHVCGSDWATLPQLTTTREQFLYEQKLLSWYDFFFLQGTPLLRRAALQLMTGSTRKHLSLGDLVVLLVQRGRSPQDVQRWMGRASWRGAKRIPPKGEDSNS